MTTWPAAWADLPECPKRHLPVPYSTARHPDGTGRFAVNDVARKVECGRDRLCGVCGRSIGWWVVFLAEDYGTQMIRRQVFTDAPLHETCAEASLEACPFIRRPRVPRHGEPAAAAPWCFDPDKAKPGWLMHVTHAYELVRQPARGGGVVWAFLPGPAVRIRRFTYAAGELQETGSTGGNR